jgi:hypothetical protein
VKDNPILDLSFTAAADLSAKQYYAVKINSSGNIALCSVAGEMAVGVLQNKPESGQSGQVRPYGVTLGILGGTVADGAKVGVDASGKFVTHVGGACVGIALQGGSANEYGEILLLPQSASYATLCIPITLANITTAGDVVTAFTPGFNGKIASMQFIVTTAVTTGSKAATLNAEIGTTNVTGGEVALTSANCTPLGAVVAGAAITGNNTFSSTDTISIEASSVTAFAEGAGVLVIVLQAF